MGLGMLAVGWAWLMLALVLSLNAKVMIMVMEFFRLQKVHEKTNSYVCSQRSQSGSFFSRHKWAAPK